MTPRIRTLNDMAKQSAGAPTAVARRGLLHKEQFDAVLNHTGDYVREKPGQSLLYAFIAGFIWNRLPIGRILGGIFRLAGYALKPAILIYGATKLYEAMQSGESFYRKLLNR
jgi:hypothetical protein